jgi:hypothetical protein
VARRVPPYHRDKSRSWQHPTQLGNDAINDFLTYLAVNRKVSASTQNQAFSAILFLYRKVLKLEISWRLLKLLTARREAKSLSSTSPSTGPAVMTLHRISARPPARRATLPLLSPSVG